jgi:hypothetical protein
MSLSFTKLCFASDRMDSLSPAFTEPRYLANGAQSLSSSVTELNSSAAFTTGELNAASFSTSDAISASFQLSSAADGIATSDWNHSAGSQASTFVKTWPAAADLSSAEYQQRVSLLRDHEAAVPSCHLPDTLFSKALKSSFSSFHNEKFSVCHQKPHLVEANLLLNANVSASVDLSSQTAPGSSHIQQPSNFSSSSLSAYDQVACSDLQNKPVVNTVNSSEVWRCRLCTFVNSRVHRRCDACGERQLVQYPK